MQNLQRLCTIAGVILLLFFTPLVRAITTLEMAKQRGYITCGVSTGIPGFSYPDNNGRWSGLDVDVCRAVAAAALGSASQVRFIPLTTRERFKALSDGTVDILSRNTTWTLSRDAGMGFNHAGIIYHDGQGFMVNKDRGYKNARDLSGAIVCVKSNTTSEKNLIDYFETLQISIHPLILETTQSMTKAFESERCDALTSDRSQLFALRLQLSKSEKAYILPDIISKEPLGPLVRNGDDQWFDIIRWTLAALINGEELGVSSNNVDVLSQSKNPDIQNLLILGSQQEIGMGQDWSYRILKQVGNYDEIFSRNLGEQSALKIKRGLNALWNQGGILYAPPFR